MERITIAGLFSELTSADQVIEELLQHGFKRSQISVASEASTYKSHPLNRRRLAAFKPLDLREVGRVMVAGPAAEDVAASGDLEQWLAEAGLPKRKSHQVLSGMREGGTLIVVQVGEDEAENALELFSGTHGSGGAIEDAAEPFSGTHGSGGGIGGYMPGDLIMSSKSGLLRKLEQKSGRGAEPPFPEEEGGTRGSGGEIGG